MATGAWYPNSGRSFYAIPPTKRRLGDLEYFDCYAEAWDVQGEYNAAESSRREPDSSLSRRPDESQEEREARENRTTALRHEEVWRTANKTRLCEFFTRHRPGLTFEGHVALRERHGQRTWVLIEAFVGGVTGGLLTLVATIVTLLLTRD